MKGKFSKEFKKLYQLTKSNTPCVNCIYRAFHLQTSESDIPQLPVVWLYKNPSIKIINMIESTFWIKCF